MKSATRRLAASAIALAAIGLAAAAAAGKWPPARSLVPLAAMWLVLLGWGFHAALRRHLQFHDQLAFAHALLGSERHARAQAEQALEEAHTALCRKIGQQEQVRERERNRIARDIHDDLGQHLLALKIELTLMQVSTHGAHPPIHQQTGALIDQVGATIQSLRRIINDLRPLALEHGLRTAMETHLSEFSRVNGIRHELDADPEAFKASPDHAIDAMLFRILQESLANVVRHAQATEVKIALTRNGDLLTLNVRDNGIGMTGTPATRGCGLAGIADRVTASGGKFVIDSTPGAGTSLTLSIPLLRPATVQSG
ncbi:MAG: sensor histidine kinase [Pseudomonadota bacterium]